MNTTNNHKPDFLDILFDGRNKDYGAYDLRRSADNRVRNAIVGTASIALVIIGGYVVNNKLMASSTPKRTSIMTEIPVMENLPPEEKRVTPPPTPPATPPPPAASSIKVTTPSIVEDDKVRPEDELPPLDSMFHKRIDVVTTIGDPLVGDNNPFEGGPGNGPIVEPPKKIDRTTPMTYVEIMPTFPGGEAALAKFLQQNIHYPQMAVENGIQGRVFVQFVIDYEGKISTVETVGAQKGGGLEQEAIRVVKLMPKWNPGKQNGQTVSVRFNLPVGFQLQ